MANPVLTKGFPTGSGPIVSGDRMTASGVSRASLILLALFAPAAAWGWSQVDIDESRFPTWVLGALLMGLACVIFGTFKAPWARFIAPVYAVVEGALVGAISAVYATAYEGIVTQAILGTFLTVVVMAVLYATRTIRVTEKMRSIVMVATGAIFLFYLVSFGLSFFGVTMPFVWDAGPIGILFSVGVIVLAAFNLLLDFDLIERGVKGGAPAYMNWYAAFGLLVTIVWLYLEILRLLAKLQRR
ncbi:MAG: Bax inhibitor-1/YccA family protein [Acidimicrobiia bacterium]|nr:Bax inhibitor-1/YccA family protein [Acidimicrobiia bacterium]MDH4306712.1 Bax inhibitor-1/YccA family protein [Acidimicrobiia bacterium]MDH5292685.1 Bax inhibitor-1/YccA family protein [Acidimicrobiia bacterium]